MATSTNRQVVHGRGAALTLVAYGMAWGAALGLAASLFCLTYASFREGPSLSLHELSRSESALMSCARDTGPLSSAELLWCSDGSSPLCLPALPASGRVELSEAPPVALQAQFEVSTPSAGWPLPGWQRAQDSSSPHNRDPERLERPPRA